MKKLIALLLVLVGFVYLAGNWEHVRSSILAGEPVHTSIDGTTTITNQAEGEPVHT
ncbi:MULTISPECIES: hypothetical protein [Thermoactinomyces]|uniref:Uncharacterized protein n=1 Tax=Thermoactinomyces daqus TaxID=1329516 RepID=A0A7W1XB91_9BACL|nr:MULTISPECIES: hypothetical protein [Thermoactinomyces]MBA4543439.1 hypothetical protein [Thermoactinomyces daqus]MBH8606033.1 hypothetical protein [Thermoactinomyces sp. CICC 10521]